MNLSLICLSLKYVNKRYNLISNVSKWIYFELTKNNYSESRFIESLNKKDFETIKVLIKFNKNIDLLSEFLVKYCSCIANYFNIIKLLMDNGADIHAENDKALMWASEKGHLDIIKILIQNGANIHTKNDQPLVSAASRGHNDIVKLLIDNGANLNIDSHESPLIMACKYNLIDTAKLLIDNGADIHIKNGSPLWVAIQKGHTDIVKLLIDSGADIHTKNDNLVRMARQKGHTDIVKLLIDSGADENNIPLGQMIEDFMISLLHFGKS